MGQSEKYSGFSRDQDKGHEIIMPRRDFQNTFCALLPQYPPSHLHSLPGLRDNKSYLAEK